MIHNCRTSFLVTLLVCLLATLSCGPSYRKPTPARMPLLTVPPLPFEIDYIQGDLLYRTTGLNVDEHRVTTMWVDKVWLYSKVGREEFKELSELLHSAEFREVLRQTRWTSNKVRYRCNKLLTFYGIPWSTLDEGYPSYAVCLDNHESIRPEILSLIEIVDRCGVSAWSAKYDPIMPYVKGLREEPLDADAAHP